MRGASFFAAAGPVSHDACRRRREIKWRKDEKLLGIIIETLMREEGRRNSLALVR